MSSIKSVLDGDYLGLLDTGIETIRSNSTAMGEAMARALKARMQGQNPSGPAQNTRDSFGPQSGQNIGAEVERRKLPTSDNGSGR
jgi:hypothetical protein